MAASINFTLTNHLVCALELFLTFKIICMKFNWGTGIFTFLALFITAAIVFIIFAVRQSVNLVERDYYEQGSDYDKQIETRARSAQYEQLVKVTDASDSVRVEFPADLSGRIDSGNVIFYRPSDSKLDLRFPLKPASNIFPVTKQNTIPGRYIIHVQWFMQGKEYLVRKDIIFK